MSSGSRTLTAAAAQLQLQASASGAATAAQEWEKMITHWYPRLEERAYFVPAVHLNKEKLDKQHVGHVEVLVPRPPVEDRQHGDRSLSGSDVRDDRTTQRLLACLRALADRQNEVMFVLSQLDYGDYLGEPCYSAAASFFKRPIDLKRNKQQQKKKGQPGPAVVDEGLHMGDFDLLVFHRDYGLLVGEVKTVGDNFSSLQLSQQEEDAIVAKKVEQAVKQLDKAEKVLTHLVSDLQPPPRVRKSLMLPNISRTQLQRVLGNNPHLEQTVQQCMAVPSGVNPVDMCLCSDNLSNAATPFDVTDDVMTELLQWWGHVMKRDGPDSSFKTHYTTVVSRFAGPATTVRVFSASTARRPHVHTEGEAASATGHCFTRIVLHPDQLDVLHQDLPLVYLLGPPGTGKTLVLVLRAVKWILDGHDVHIVCALGKHSLAAASMIRYQIEQMTGPHAQHQLHLHVTDIWEEAKLKTTVQDLVASVDSRGRLFVIADESAYNPVDFFISMPTSKPFTSFCEELQRQINELHLWSASCTDSDIPPCFTQVPLAEPLRSPPALVRRSPSRST